MPRKIWIVSGVTVVSMAATIAAWTVCASVLLCKFTGNMPSFVFPYAQWFMLAPEWWLTNWFSNVCIIGSAAIPTIILLLVGIAGLTAWLRRRKLRRPFGGGLKPVEQGVTLNHGRAYWPDIAEMKRRFPPPPAHRGGIVIGEARRIDLEPCAKVAYNGRDPSTWGMGGKATLLLDDPLSDTSPSPHSLMFIGTGGGKTMHAISTQYSWRGSLVTFDPSTEIGPMVKRWREKLGQKTVFIGYPMEPDEVKALGFDRQGIDVLDCIQPHKPGAAARVLSMVASICGEEAKRKDPNSAFDSAGRNIIGCFMAHMMYDVSDRPKTIEELVSGLTIPEPEMQELLQKIAITSQSELARRLAITVMNTPQVTFGGAYFNLGTMAGWILDPENARMLSGPLKPSAILGGNLSIYIQIPIATLLTSPGVGRVIADSLVSTAIRANGKCADFVLFQADEAALLGRMMSLEILLKVGRKYKMAVQLIYTSIDDMREIWSENGLKTWLNGVSWSGFAAVTNETGELISKAFGKHGIMAYSEGQNNGTSSQMMGSGSRSKGSNTNVHEISTNLINPDDFKDSRTDELFIITRSGRGFRCGMCPYYRRPEIAKEIGANTYFEDAA